MEYQSANSRPLETELFSDESRSYLGKLLAKYKACARNAAIGSILAAAPAVTATAYSGVTPYERGPEIIPLEEHYIPDGIVAWTDAHSKIIEHRDERKIYDQGFARLHEEGHIAYEKASKPHDEARLNREALVKLNRQIPPFPSYHDPNFY